MIRTDIEPIGHISPRKPVELNPRAAVTKTPHRAGEISEQHARVWDAVVSTATGSNISGAAPDITQVDGVNEMAEWWSRMAEIVRANDGQPPTELWAGGYLDTDSDNDDYMG